MPPEDRRDFVKGISCPKCRKRIPEHAEKERALSSLIETLNQIEAEVRQILATLRSPKGISSIRDADSLAGAFFYSCQIGEERIRTARKKDYITDVQVQALNNELRGFVRKILEVSGTSPLLRDAVKQLSETEPGLKALLAAV
jgi:hypothetical protein